MNENTQAERRPLEEGSRVGEYRIVRCLGSNGEGIFYLAQDCIVGDVVQLQEFFPAGIACRCEDADALQPVA
ncbi:MAG: serine/threonine protein kinase, partial [Negativibacillus sp.]